jgi:predicted nucleic acid-binding protein
LIYVDSSVVLAELLGEDRAPSPSFWQNSPVASQLAQYEVWTRLHRTGLGMSHGKEARALLERLIFVDMLPSVLERALEPFPIALRTLDALHLSTAEYLRRAGHDVELASYDARLLAAAKALGIKIAQL